MREPSTSRGCRTFSWAWALVLVCTLTGLPGLASADATDRPNRFTLYPAPLAFSGTRITSDGVHGKSTVASQLDMTFGRAVASFLEFGLGAGVSREHESHGTVIGRVYGYVRPFVMGRRNAETGVRLALGAAAGTVADRDIGLGVGPYVGVILDHRRVLKPGLTIDFAVEASVSSTPVHAPSNSYARGNAATFTFTPKVGLTWSWKPSPSTGRSKSTWRPKGADQL